MFLNKHSSSFSWGEKNDQKLLWHQAWNYFCHWHLHLMWISFDLSEKRKRGQNKMWYTEENNTTLLLFTCIYHKCIHKRIKFGWKCAACEKGAHSPTHPHTHTPPQRCNFPIWYHCIAASCVPEKRPHAVTIIKMPYILWMFWKKEKIARSVWLNEINLYVTIYAYRSF